MMKARSTDKLISGARVTRNLIAVTILVIAGGSFGRLYSQDGLLTDRDGNRYLIKKMPDNNIWMAANLQLNIPGSYCYEKLERNCEQYGRLYTWESAQKVCSLLGEGWKLPTTGEWQGLARNYGFPGDSADYPKSAYSALLVGGRSGLNVLLGGGRDGESKYGRLDAHGFYWTATEDRNNTARYCNFARGAQSLFYQDGGEKSRAFSVRCVKIK